MLHNFSLTGFAYVHHEHHHYHKKTSNTVHKDAEQVLWSRKCHFVEIYVQIHPAASYDLSIYSWFNLGKRHLLSHTNLCL